MAGLLEFLQAASNSAASNVSAPVDGIAWLLKKAGIDVGTPVGGSDWMEQRGLTKPVKQSGASVAGETAGLLSPMLLAAKAPQVAKGLLQMADNAAAPRSAGMAASQRGAFIFPREEAMKTAQKNATEMLGLPPNNTAADRARALGFDSDAYHATAADFAEFSPHPYRGAVSVAATPEGSIRGAKAGMADGTGSGASKVMPLLMRTEGVQGLTFPKQWRDFAAKLPSRASESDVDNLMKSAPRGSSWTHYFTEVETAPGSFEYIKKPATKVSFVDVQRTRRGADSFAIPNWGSERQTANRVKSEGDIGWLQADEAGISASIVDPSALRSRFAAFDPARANEPDLLATLAAMGIGLPALVGLMNGEGN